MVAAELATLEKGGDRKSKNFKAPNGALIDDVASLLMYREAMKEQGKRTDLGNNVPQVEERSDRGNSRAYSLDRECAKEHGSNQHRKKEEGQNCPSSIDDAASLLGDAKDARRKGIFELWLAGWTNKEAAELTGLTEEAVRQQTQEMADLPKLGKPDQSLATHATDCSPPIYNIWKQQPFRQIFLKRLPDSSLNLF